MDYSVIYGGLILYLSGCLTIFALFYKRILNDNSDNNPGTSQKPFNKLTRKIHSLFSSTIDLSLYAKTIDAIELERERIGSDIHDELAAYLTSVCIDLEIVINKEDYLSHETMEMLKTMRTRIKYALDSLRRIVHGMLPATLETQNLNEAVEDLCRKNDCTKGTTILFRTSGYPTTLSTRQDAYIYRIIQEVLTNSIKHSLAWNIYVSLLWTKQQLKVVIKDTGKGMPNNVKGANKFGLTGIFLRSSIIGATSKFNTPFGGTEFELVLKLTDDEFIESNNAVEESKSY